MLLVGLGVLDVQRRMRDVEIAAQHRLAPAGGRLVAQLAEPDQHGVQEAVLLRHLDLVVAVAGMHVHAGHRDHVPLRRADVGLDPPARVHVLVQTRQPVPAVDDRQVAQQAHAGASLDAADLVHRRQLPLITDLARGGVFSAEFGEDRIDFLLRGAHLLHAPHIRRVRAGPCRDALAPRRADAVDIRSRDRNRHTPNLSTCTAVRPSYWDTKKGGPPRTWERAALKR